MTSSRPERSSNTTLVRWPRLRTSSDESGDARGLARIEAPGLARTERPSLKKIADARGHEARQIGFEAVDRVPREGVQAERLALAGEPYRLAPIRQGCPSLRRRGGRARLGTEPEEIILTCLMGACVCSPSCMAVGRRAIRVARFAEVIHAATSNDASSARR